MNNDHPIPAISDLSDTLSAVLLAGGIGSRLQPLTNRIPKPLLPVANVPMLGQILHGLALVGVQQAALATGYKADMVREVMGDGAHYGVSLQHVVECHPLGSGGALRHVCEQITHWPATDLWVAGADILHDVNIAAALESHRKNQAAVTIVCFAVDNPAGFGIVEFEPDGRVTAFYEKPAPGVTTSRWANAALWIFSREIIDLLPPGPSSLETEFFPRLLAESVPVYAFQHSGYWLDCGTPERYLQVQRAALAGRFPAVLDGATTHTALDAHSLLGSGCTLEATARIRNSVVGAGSQIGANVVLNNCILLPGASIGARSHLQSCIIDSGTTVAPDTSLENVIV
jgi:mannose-1-phosphate guanylyltransferase